jgi:hypothetical protein
VGCKKPVKEEEEKHPEDGPLAPKHVGVLFVNKFKVQVVGVLFTDS